MKRHARRAAAFPATTRTFLVEGRRHYSVVSCPEDLNDTDQPQRAAYRYRIPHLRTDGRVVTSVTTLPVDVTSILRHGAYILCNSSVTMTYGRLELLTAPRFCCFICACIDDAHRTLRAMLDIQR